MEKRLLLSSYFKNSNVAKIPNKSAEGYMQDMMKELRSLLDCDEMVNGFVCCESVTLNGMPTLTWSKMNFSSTSLNCKGSPDA